MNKEKYTHKSVSITPFDSHMCNLTSPAKLGFGDVCGGWTTAGVGTSSTVSSITAGVISFMSRFAGEISEDDRVSTGGMLAAADLKAKESELMEWRKNTELGRC